MIFTNPRFNLSLHDKRKILARNDLELDYSKWTRDNVEKIIPIFNECQLLKIKKEIEHRGL